MVPGTTTSGSTSGVRVLIIDATQGTTSAAALRALTGNVVVYTLPLDTGTTASADIGVVPMLSFSSAPKRRWRIELRPTLPPHDDAAVRRALTNTRSKSFQQMARVPCYRGSRRR